jgi:hypothetical protein
LENRYKEERQNNFDDSMSKGMRFLAIDCNIIKVYDPVINWAVNIEVTPKGFRCSRCDTDDCNHVEFALEQTNVQNAVRKMRKQGWNLPGDI